MRPVQGRHGASGGGAPPTSGAPAARRGRDRARTVGGDWIRDERRVDLRARANCLQRRRVGSQAASNVLTESGGRGMSAPLVQLRTRAPRRNVELQIDGDKVSVPEGTTILDACQQRGQT